MIKKNWAFALGMFALTTSIVSADQAGNGQAPQPMPMGVTSQPTGVVTPPVAPRVAHGADVFVTADFIWWKAQQNGLEYAYTGFSGSGATAAAERGKVELADSDGQPGFKVGIGLEFEHDGWDLYANYTWLNPASHHNSISADETELLPTITSPADVTKDSTSLHSASSHWRLNFNVVDLELGRNFFVSRFMTLRPHFGLKSAWINQKYDVEYTVTNETEIEMKLRTWGIGIRAGLNPVWHFTRCWGLYGNLALAAMYTSVKSTREDTRETPAGVETEYFDTKESFHVINPVLEFGLGLTYMTWFYDEAYMLDLSAGWEEQIWIGTNNFVNIAGSGAGDLDLQGFTFKVGFHF